MSWKGHFEVPDPFPNEGTLKIKCIHCQQYISGNARTTSNFSTHLKRKHRNMLLLVGQDDKSQDQQKNIETYLNRKSTKYGSNERKQVETTDLLVRLIAGTLSPFRMLDCPEFKKFVNILDPCYNLPDRKTLATTHLDKVYVEVESALKQKLKQAENICVTIDIWSNRQMRGFLGITGHMILDWHMDTVMIACKRFRGRHTGENIRQEYEECVMAYDIAEKITNIISDNASNMKKAFSLSLPGYTEKPDVKTDEMDSSDDEDYIESDEADEILEDEFPTCSLGHCFAHTLQLVVKDGLKELNQHLKTLVGKASTLVKFVRKSVLASEILEDEKRLQSENVTRWNSQVLMIRSVLSVKEDKLNSVGAPCQISSYERKLLKELLSILEPFEEATLLVQAEKSVTSSLVVPVILGLKNKLEIMSKVYNNKMVSTLKLSVEKRLETYVTNDSYVLAALLDPNFKQRWCADQESMEEKLIDYARKMEENQRCLGDDQEDVTSPPENRAKVDDCGLLSFMTPKTKRTRNRSGDNVKLEVSQYLQEPCTERQDVLSYWQDNESNFPILAKLAKRYLVIQATSAPVERLFSIAGKFFRPDRCNLSDSTFQKLMMIKCNSK